MTSETTTILVHVETKEQLDELKIHPRETYDDIIKRLIKATVKRSS